MTEKTVRETFEISYDANRANLYPWGEMHFTKEGVFWDSGEPVDFAALEEAGYIRRVRITETKEYLS